jgi:hypothetical protein
VVVRPGLLLLGLKCRHNLIGGPPQHNFSDGLALGVAFGKGIGLPTTAAVFFHEARAALAPPAPPRPVLA